MASREVAYKFRDYKISYEITNQNSDKSVLFLHGWGAQKSIMKKAFSRFLGDFRHIYVDLPGFGNTQAHHSLNSKEYAKIMQKFLDSLAIKPDIIIGHSFGGKIATLLNPPCLVLLSSAGIVPRKRFLVRLKIFIFKIFKFFGGAKFFSLFASNDVKGMSPLMYETFKKVVNEDFSSEFSKFNNKAYIFWGKTDNATPLRSGELIHACIENSEFFPLEGDHFFFLLHAEFITNIIQEYKNED